MFAALRNVLLTSTAHLLDKNWCLASDEKKIKWLLNGVSYADFHTNVNLFKYVQSFISQSIRFLICNCLLF